MQLSCRDWWQLPQQAIRHLQLQRELSTKSNLQQHNFKWKKRSEETQTLRAGCSKSEPKISPRRRPFPEARDGQNLTSWWWSLPLPTNPVWWGSMHAISSYRDNRPTHKQTHTHTHIHPQTGPITIHCAAARAQCNYTVLLKLNAEMKNNEIASTHRRKIYNPCLSLSPSIMHTITISFQV